MEYVDVRGNNCFNCTMPWFQSKLLFFHTESVGPTNCQKSIADGSDYVWLEDNFGFYLTRNSKFRCTETLDSTTNMWFGVKHE